MHTVAQSPIGYCPPPLLFCSCALPQEDSPAVDLEALTMTLAEVAAAMAYLHAHRITHRDLKPKNILLRTSDKDRRGFVAKVGGGGEEAGLVPCLP